MSRSLVSVIYLLSVFIFFFKHKTAYEMRISDWSSDVCSSDLVSGRQEWSDIAGFLMIFDDMFAGPAIDFLLREAGRVIGVHPAQQKIGRASCRERVCQYV